MSPPPAPPLNGGVFGKLVFSIGARTVRKSNLITPSHYGEGWGGVYNLTAAVPPIISALRGALLSLLHGERAV